jgi:hypothetical protein
MAWTEPEYSKNQVDMAGGIWTGAIFGSTNPDPNTPEFAELEKSIGRAYTIINNWRAAHSFPLNTFTIGLRRKVGEIERGALVAQRIKRLSAIEQKLRRFPNMKLSRMQDIGGCRAIVNSVAHVKHLVEQYLSSDIKHGLDRVDDYIAQPKPDGYRSVHLIYRYRSDRRETYNGLKIEMQFRSKLQHAWATAVETVGTLINQSLKADRGEEDWLRFFKLMGTAIAIRENCAPVPDTPTKADELRQELTKLSHAMDVEGHLQAYGAALQELQKPSNPDAHIFLLELDSHAKHITITGYKFRDLHTASSDYFKAERSILQKPGSDAVLVRVDSLAKLRRAYPNYFLDTHTFLNAFRQAIQ